MDSLSENIDVIVFEKELNENKEIENNDVNDKNHQREADVKIMHKKVCFGCEKTFVGTNEEELNKRFWKVHWDDQNPFITECQFCENIYHGNDQDSVNKRVLEHEKICKDNNEKEDFEGYLDDNDSFIATCHLCEISFNDNDEDSVNKRFLEHEKICKGNNDKEDVEGNLDDNDNDNNYQEEHKDSILFINELLIDEIKKSSMSLKEKSKLLKPLKFLKDEKTCKGNNEKEDVEGDLDDNDKKIKKMQMKNHNCKTPPPTPPTKEPSNFLKPHLPTKTMKAVVKIKKLLLPTPSSKKLFYPSPTKGPSNLLKPHRPTKSPRKKLSPPPPPPPKNLKQNLKRGHDLFEKDREDVISLKKRIKSPGKGKQTAGKKRNRKAAFLNLDEEEDEESPKRTRRQTRSETRDQEDTRNSNQANFQGGF